MNVVKTCILIWMAERRIEEVKIEIIDWYCSAVEGTHDRITQTLL